MAGAHAELTITGVDDSVEEILRAFVTVDDLACKSPRWWVNRAFRRTADEARQALETLGYYQAKIDAEMSWQDACWQASLAVEPGNRARMRNVDIRVEGGLASEQAMREFLAERVLRSRRAFTHQRYESAKTRMLDIAEDLGYFDARFERARVLVDPQANVADIELTLVSGERYRIGEITIEQDELRPELFGKFLRLRAGQPFDARDLAATYRDLLGSQYFDRVMVTPEIELREGGYVPVRVAASATVRRTVLLGGGYATDTGPRARADLRYRRLNDRGHRANLSSLVSGVQGEVKGDYRIPWGDPAREWLFAESSLSYEDTDSYVNRNWMVGVGRTHQRTVDWTETNYVNFQVDDFDVGGEFGRSQLLLLGSSWTRKTLTDDPRPLTGYALSFDVRGAAQALLSETDVLQTIARARHIFPLGKRVRVLSRAYAGLDPAGSSSKICRPRSGSSPAATTACVATTLSPSARNGTAR
jgi:translocation and assembly module TamA